MPTDVMTMCFHTRDAIERDESSFTFRMPSGRLRTDAVKVALASCEFPMVQWTVEETWNRLYMNEGIALSAENNAIHAIVGDMRVPACIRLPPRTNPVASITRRGTTVSVACAHEHGLWVADGSSVNAAIFVGGVCLLGASDGDVVLDASSLTRVSDTEFTMKSTCDVAGVHTLLTSTIPSPTVLASVLTHAARGCFGEEVRLTFDYDARSDTVIARVTCPPGTRGMVRLINSPLLRLLGVSSMPVTMTDHTSVTVPSESTAMWDYVTIPSGFYAPCHRPMCTGQPMRFGAEVETSINRLYFPITKQGEPPHQLVFSDPDGRVYIASVPAGRYSPSSLSRHLERAMTSAAGDGQTFSFSVSHDDDRFTFSCEQRIGNCVEPCPFGLLFHHPICMDAERLGFPAQPLSGSDTYIASRATRFPAVRNIVRVSEISHQKRFRFHATAPPPMMAQVLGAGPQKNTVRVCTHVNRVPFAHGYREGDVVVLATCGSSTIVSDGKERTLDASVAQVPPHCRCLVANGGQEGDVTILVLRVPPLNGIADAGTALQVTSVAEPWNACVGVHVHSLPPHLLGLRRGATQWGIDGTIVDMEGRLLPPIDAPHVHCLDHPDYVLLTFSESAGAHLEHSYDNENKQVFCKLSLYPLFREERMLPRDTTLMRGNMSTFRISFWNPDMRTPYHFHGAEFSFSLNFVSALPE